MGNLNFSLKISLFACMVFLISSCGGGGGSGNSVDDVVLTSIEVTPSTASISLPQSATQQFTAIGYYSDGSTSDLTSTVTWNSDATGVAQISSGGLASTVSTGQVVISATSEGVTGNASLVVFTTPVISSVAPGTSGQDQLWWSQVGL